MDVNAPPSVAGERLGCNSDAGDPQVPDVSAT